jgi:uncharacterized protein YaiI (UPF0178 family)
VSEPRILVDADACPVKDEVYRVAERYGTPVSIVSNAPFRVPPLPFVERIIVNAAFDAADDWIAERAGPATIVVTGDILLAERCVKAGATVIAHNGRPFTARSIGQAVAQRALMADLRAMEVVSGGPAPFTKADRSRFLSALDEAINLLRRQR